MRLHILGPAVLYAVSLAACGLAAAPAATPSSLATASPPAAEATPRAQSTPAPTLLNPAPPEMLGKWSVEFADGDLATITIKETGIRIKRFATADVRLEVFGDEAILSHSQLCTGEGRYRWSIEGEELTFESIEPDVCDGRAKTFDGVTFTRVPG
jgi:hypothetical protein